MGFTVRKGFEKGSQKGFLEGGFQKVPRNAPRRVRPLRPAPYNLELSVCVGGLERQTPRNQANSEGLQCSMEAHLLECEECPPN